MGRARAAHDARGVGRPGRTLRPYRRLRHGSLSRPTATRVQPRHNGTGATSCWGISPAPLGFALSPCAALPRSVKGRLKGGRSEPLTECGNLRRAARRFRAGRPPPLGVPQSHRSPNAALAHRLDGATALAEPPENGAGQGARGRRRSETESAYPDHDSATRDNLAEPPATLGRSVTQPLKVTT